MFHRKGCFLWSQITLLQKEITLLYIQEGETDASNNVKTGPEATERVQR